ncbi:MAG: TIGR02186 family protein [Devosia sp.]
MRRMLFALLLAIAASPAAAERLVSTVSTPVVEITSSFDGVGLSLFGNILPDVDSPTGIAEGPYNIIIVVTGPLQDRVARMKTNTFGIWTNTDEFTFKLFPSYYAVIASGRLENIADETVLAEQSIHPEAQAILAAGQDTLKARRFGRELVRLMTQEGHLTLNEDGVQFLSDTAYTARVNLPSDVVNGAFIAHTLVFKNKVLVAERSEGFSARKSGVERFVFVTARQQPLFYGLACVILALGTGWLAGVAFKR